MRVMIDSNFLIDLVRFKIPVEEIFELVGYDAKLFVLSSVLKELEKIAMRKSKEAKYAKASLKLIELKKIEIFECEEKADKALFSLASKDTVIATNDKILREKLRRKNLKTIYVKAKKRLGLS